MPESQKPKRLPRFVPLEEANQPGFVLQPGDLIENEDAPPFTGEVPPQGKGVLASPFDREPADEILNHPDGIYRV